MSFAQEGIFVVDAGAVHWASAWAGVWANVSVVYTTGNEENYASQSGYGDALQSG